MVTRRAVAGSAFGVTGRLRALRARTQFDAEGSAAARRVA